MKRIPLSQEAFQALYLASPNAILIIEGDNGEILGANPAAQRLLGSDDAALRGKHCGNVLVPGPGGSEAELVERLAHNRTLPEIQRVRRADGSSCPVEASTTVISWEEGPAIFATLRDVSERVLAEEEIRRRNHELALINQAGRAFSSSLNLDQVLAAVLEEVRRVMEAVGSSLWLVDPPTGELACRLATGPQGKIVQGWRLEAGQGLIGWVAQAGQSLSVPDLQADARHFREIDLQTGLALRAAVTVPLEIKQQVIGVLQVVDSQVDRFDAEDVALLESIAAAAAIAIENAQLFEQTRQGLIERLHAEESIRRRNQELEMLNRVITTATSTLDVAQVLQIACEELARAFDVPQAQAALFNAETTEATVVAEYRKADRPSRLGKSVLIRENPTLQQIIETHVHVSATDPETEERLAPVRELLAERGAASLLVMPVPVARGRIAGVIGLEGPERHAFSPEEIGLAQSVAGAAGQALETARLYQAVRRHAERLQETVAQRTAELQEALARARDADRIKSEFVSDVSHELRTPLTNLKLYLGLLNRGGAGRRQAYMETLYRETDRLQDLIEGLLDLSRLDLGKSQIRLRPIDLDHLLETLISDRAALAAERNLILELKRNGRLSHAMADPKLFEQVVTNLLTNAINYTPEGGRITLGTEEVEEEGCRWATVSVTDTGPGISEAEQGRLFERFFRGEAGAASDAPGTGLGLAICKEIMELHSGRITVESQVGQGSTFTVWLCAA